MYLSADLDTLVHLLARLNLRGFIEEPMETVSDRLRQQVAHVLAVYRKHCNPASNMGQVVVVVVVVVYLYCILVYLSRLAHPSFSSQTTPLLLKLYPQATRHAPSYSPTQLPGHESTFLLQTTGNHSNAVYRLLI